MVISTKYTDRRHINLFCSWLQDNDSRQSNDDEEGDAAATDYDEDHDDHGENHDDHDDDDNDDGVSLPVLPSYQCDKTSSDKAMQK